MNTSSRIWLKIYLKIMTFIFKHPKYYKELRKRNKLAESRQPVVGGQQQSDQAISSRVDVATSSAQRAPGQGHKPQAASFKPKATSFKLQDLRTTKKFHGAWTEVLNADEGVVRMPYMKGYLVWWKANLVTLCDFKFYCEKGARIIIAQ